MCVWGVKRFLEELYIVNSIVNSLILLFLNLRALECGTETDVTVTKITKHSV